MQHHLGLGLLITRQAVPLVKRRRGEKKQAPHAGPVSEQVQKLQHRRKRQVSLIIFTEKGTRQNGSNHCAAKVESK